MDSEIEEVNSKMRGSRTGLLGDPEAAARKEFRDNQARLIFNIIASVRKNRERRGLAT